MFTVSQRLIRTAILKTNIGSVWIHSKKDLWVSGRPGQIKGNIRLKWKNMMIKNYSSDSPIPENEICYETITNGDKELEHKLKVIILEAEVMRQDGKAVPSNAFFTTEHWEHLLSLPTRTARRKYFEFLFKVSKKKENREAKKTEKRLKREEFYETQNIKEESNNEGEFALKYDLKHNNLFLRIYDTTINQMYNNKLVQSMMFGQKLVVDCGYDDKMTKRENVNCAKQLMLLFAENRGHVDPFDLHYCNANPQGMAMKVLHKFIPPLYETSFPLNMHQCSYLDIFSKDKLVYLTPHCREELTEYDHDTVYIIGAIVDKINNEPLSLAKAKKEGIRMAKFPLDKYLQWSAGSGKSLTLNQVASILNDVKVTGNWEYALRHVPKRKLTDFNSSTNVNKMITNLNNYKDNRRDRRWVPSKNVDFKNITGRNKEKDRIVDLNSIINS